MIYYERNLLSPGESAEICWRLPAEKALAVKQVLAVVVVGDCQW